jgi:hypothetical protein
LLVATTLEILIVNPEGYQRVHDTKVPIVEFLLHQWNLDLLYSTVGTLLSFLSVSSFLTFAGPPSA